MILYQSICIKNRKVTTPQSHDTVAIVLQALTRSVVVINLLRYLQTLTLTGYQKLKHYKHLITNIIVTRYLNQPHATLQIPRHTSAAHRDKSMLTTGTINRWIAPGNVYYHNCRAVIANARLVSEKNESLTLPQ